MPTSPDFVTFALDLVAPLGPVEARRMFGGHGLYARGVMFGLLDDDELFLKTDEVSRPRFEEAGCRRWVYGRMESTSYFRPPDPAHEDPEAMLPWARLALDAALRLQAEKVRRKAEIARRKAASASRKGASSAATGEASRAKAKKGAGGARRQKAKAPAKPRRPRSGASAAPSRREAKRTR